MSRRADEGRRHPSDALREGLAARFLLESARHARAQFVADAPAGLDRLIANDLEYRVQRPVLVCRPIARRGCSA